MSKFFSSENPVFQGIAQFGDMIFLNILYAVCCIPVFTIGAAQAGLYTAMKVMQDKGDDSSVYAAFFRGFRAGFGTITLTWIVSTILMLICTGVIFFALVAELPWWAGIVPALLLCLVSSLLPIYHSRFGCTFWQLVRNVFALLFARPLHALCVAVLTWLPLGLALWNLQWFLSVLPAWFGAYYSIAFWLNYRLMRKTFDSLVERFYAAQEAEALPE